jgi:lipid-binding SYLF domain-containing protein
LWRLASGEEASQVENQFVFVTFCNKSPAGVRGPFKLRLLQRVVGVARTLAVVHLGFLFSGAFGEGLY